MQRHEQHHDYQRIAQALAYLEANRAVQPSLDDVAGHVGLSPFHLQRVFSEWAGISPKRFLQFLTVDHARRCLAETRSVLEATFAAGLSSPGRLHDLMVSVDAMTPGEYKRRGRGLVISWGIQATPFGDALIGATDRGVCWLSFPDESEHPGAVEELHTSFCNASFHEDPVAMAVWRDRIFTTLEAPGARPLPVLLAGTNFQLKVWEALLRIPPGGLLSYSDLAALAGRPTATRAVASAVAANTVAYLIPCHRVIRAMGDFGQYRWGAARKRAMIGWERGRAAAGE